MKKLYSLITFIFLSASFSFATHISGGHTQIKEIGTNTFEITVHIIRDCSGIFAPQSVPVTITDSCGISSQQTAVKTSSFFYSPFCSAAGASTCNGGSLPGFEIAQYKDTVSFSSTCNKVFAFADLGCCRPMTNNLQNAMNANIVVMAMLNRSNPLGTTPPFNYVTGMVKSYCVGIPEQTLIDTLPSSYDPKYEFYTPFGSIGSTIPFVTSNNVNNPFGTTSINAQTGLASILSNALGSYTLPVKTTILSSNPNHASYAKFEMRIMVTNCSSGAGPQISLANYTGFNLSNDTLTPCSPNNCFNIVISDTSSSSTLNILNSNLPISSSVGNNPKTLTICPTNSTSKKYYLTVEGNCPGVKSAKVFVVNPLGNPPLTGTVSSALGAVTNTKVLMVGLDTSAGMVYKIDSTFTDNSGHYMFNNVSDSIVLIKAIPDSTAYPMLIPTYHDSSLTALMAVPIPQYCYNPVADIMVKAGINPGGSGFIAGNIFQGAGKTDPGDPVPGLSLILKTSTGQLIANKVTDANGAFKFSGLNSAEYKIYVDNGSVTNQNPPVVDLSTNNEITLTFKLFKTQLAIDQTVSVQNNIQLLVESISPNPFKDQFKINSSIDGNINLQVIDVFGKTQINQNMPFIKGQNQLDFQGLSHGIYFLQVSQGEKISIHKIVKQ